jgi:hypothetical protein
MTHLQTFFLCICIAIGFGIVHDLITANICVEYFTIGHPRIIESENPFVLALVWGVVATWWFGVILGILIISYNAIGKSPSLPFITIRNWVFNLLIILSITSVLAGVIGFILSKTGVIYLLRDLAERIPKEKHTAFLAVGWAHTSSYLTGFIGTIVICAMIHLKRRKTRVTKLK